MAEILALQLAAAPHKFFELGLCKLGVPRWCTFARHICLAVQFAEHRFALCEYVLPAQQDLDGFHHGENQSTIVGKKVWKVGAVPDLLRVHQVQGFLYADGSKRFLLLTADSLSFKLFWLKLNRLNHLALLPLPEEIVVEWVFVHFLNRQFLFNYRFWWLERKRASLVE